MDIPPPNLAPEGEPGTSPPGTLSEIWIGPDAKVPLHRVEHVCAVAGRGLEGDRYFHARGSFDRARFAGGSTSAGGRAVTLIDRRALTLATQRLAEELAGKELTGGDLRRNLVLDVTDATLDPDLKNLVGATFRIGAAVLRGVRLAPPCGLLERITGGLDVRRALKGVGGLRADILEGGDLHVGDRLKILDAGRGRLPA